jgi:type IV pilus assembly protein PilV
MSYRKMTVGSVYMPPKPNGFSMIEMLIALLIIAVGLLGMAGLQAYSLKNNTSAYFRSQATILAYQLVDAMRANRLGVLNGDYSAIKVGTPVSGSSRAALDGIAWKTQLRELLPSGDGGVANCAAGSSPLVCTVIVEWDDTRGVGSAQRIAVSTLL